MTKTVNRVRNPHFSAGKDFPRHWEANFRTRDCEVHRLDAGLAMIPKTPAPAFWRQTLKCKPEAFYRLEATIQCELVPAGPSGGVVLLVEHEAPDSSEMHRATSPVHDAPGPIAIRTYFQAPTGCKQIQIYVGVRDAVGLCEILDVRFIRILEPDEISHPHAILPPFSPGAPPIDSVCICSAINRDRPLQRLLGQALGHDRVISKSPDQFPDCGEGQAILLPDPKMPPAIKTLHGLFRLAEQKLIIVSLPAFASLTRGALSVRRIEQPDDPIHAKVVYANSATRGFALHDSFAFAWPGKSPSSFVQNQFRKNDVQVAFCKKHRLETLLVSNCDTDRTSDQPICLYRETPGGGLYVIDLNPVEAPASTMSEPTLAAHLLLSVLRRSPSPAGQFCVPCRTETQLREMIREAANRWDHFYVHDEDVPSDEVLHQIVTIGREDETYGLPVAPKPVILLRTGLSGGDCESVYGVWAWLRQLLLHERYPGSYARALASKFRLAWVPCSAPWELRDGWTPTHSPPWTPMEVEADESPLAAVIDVCAGLQVKIRVLFAEKSPLFDKAQALLPQLASAFSAKAFPALACGAGTGLGSRRAYSWTPFMHGLEVIVDAGVFDDNLVQGIKVHGGTAIRIELPPYETDWVANSIHQTHLAVTVLEHVIGLLYGVIAVNRTREPVRLDDFGVVHPGQTLILHQKAPSLAERTHRFG